MIKTEERTITYDCGEQGVAEFIPKCEKCNRYVKADESISVNYDGIKDQPNATCKKCGRIKMLFLGFF